MGKRLTLTPAPSSARDFPDGNVPPTSSSTTSRASFTARWLTTCPLGITAKNRKRPFISRPVTGHWKSHSASRSSSSPSFFRSSKRTSVMSFKPLMWPASVSGRVFLSSACTTASLLYRFPIASTTTGRCSRSPDSWHRVHLARFTSVGSTLSGFFSRNISSQALRSSAPVDPPSPPPPQSPPSRADTTDPAGRREPACSLFPWWRAKTTRSERCGPSVAST
mmetsp:Transcript_14834/g.37563  ORF Transcript_14834/g.37563 Transcript_14834/m.37563 type:complete len:222 (-) Transcript_14834:132-797(-)